MGIGIVVSLVTCLATQNDTTDRIRVWRKAQAVVEIAMMPLNAFAYAVGCALGYLGKSFVKGINDGYAE